MSNFDLEKVVKSEWDGKERTNLWYLTHEVDQYSRNKDHIATMKFNDGEYRCMRCGKTPVEYFDWTGYQFDHKDDPTAFDNAMKGIIDKTPTPILAILAIMLIITFIMLSC